MALSSNGEPQAPPQNQEQLNAVLGWCTEAVEEGENFIRTQFGFDKAPDIIKNIMGDYTADMIPAHLSNITDNRFGKIANDLAASLTDIKPFWEYRTFNRGYDRQADMLGKLSLAWWTGPRSIDLRFCDVIKYGEAMGSGYAHQVWNEQVSDIDLIAEDPRDVLPVRPASQISIQDAFGVLVRRERTVNYLRRRYPRAASLIRPDRDASFASRAAARAQAMMAKMNLTSGFMDNLWASLGGRPQAQMNIPSADLFSLDVKDDSRNESTRPIWIGEGDPNGAHPNWSYWVQPRELIYPRGRNIVFTRTVVLRDGPNIYWHGQFPLDKLTLDPWPWSWLGKPLLLDLMPLQSELNRLLRGVSDHNQKVFRPDLVADKNSLSRAAMNAIDTRRAGLKLRSNAVGGQPPTIPPVPPLDPSIQSTVQFLIEEMEQLSGVRDLTQMMRLGQLPSSETVEKMLESMTPTIRLRSRVMESFLRDFAMKLASNFFQFYDTPRRLAVLGPDGLTLEDYDYDPGNLIPAFLSDDDKRSNVVRPVYERAKEFLRNFTYHVAPGSLLNAASITSKLLYVQLARAGMLDVYSCLEKLEIPNIGPAPKGNIMERLAQQAQMGIGPNQSSVGRKATAQTMPHEKGGGIVESK